MDSGHICSVYWFKIHPVSELKIWLLVVSIQYRDLGSIRCQDLKYRLWSCLKNILTLDLSYESTPEMTAVHFWWDILDTARIYVRIWHIVSGMRLTPYSSKKKKLSHTGANMLRIWKILHLVFGEYQIRISSFMTHIGWYPGNNI